LFHGKIGLDVGMNIEQYKGILQAIDVQYLKVKPLLVKNSMGWVPLKDLSIEKSSWLGML
jgi:hypothetical protein